MSKPTDYESALDLITSLGRVNGELNAEVDRLRSQLRDPQSPTQLERLFVAALTGIASNPSFSHLRPQEISGNAILLAIASLRALERLETLDPVVSDSMTAEEILIALESHLGQLRSAVYGLMSKQAMLDCLTTIERTTQQAIASLQNDDSTD